MNPERNRFEPRESTLWLEKRKPHGLKELWGEIKKAAKCGDVNPSGTGFAVEKDGSPEAPLFPITHSYLLIVKLLNSGVCEFRILCGKSFWISNYCSGGGGR